MRVLLYIIILFACAGVSAQEAVFRTNVYREDIKSLEVKVEGELISSPFITLGGEDRISISFDALHHSSGYYTYSIVHCNADWQKSMLMPIEYMKGFQNAYIPDFANSINTTVNYTNYKLSLPNDDVQFLVSGNYAVQIFDENEPDKPVITACFSIVEPLIEIGATVSGNTDIDFNKTHQQVDLTINYKDINIAFPQSDLKIFVCQNNDIDNMRTDLQPSLIGNGQLQYTHQRKLIFDAGNEYRRIEFLTHRYKGMGVADIGFFNPYYHLTLYEDRRRDGKTYLYDQDQNGRFFVRCSECNNPDTEADYYVVHFALISEFIENGEIHLYGDFFNNTIDDRSRMEYNPETGMYEAAVMLKQGLYNYKYAFVEDSKVTFAPTEGDYFETENEYTVTVFYRPAAARYDRLIGFAKF